MLITKSYPSILGMSKEDYKAFFVWFDKSEFRKHDQVFPAMAAWNQAKRYYEQYNLHKDK